MNIDLLPDPHYQILKSTDRPFRCVQVDQMNKLKETGSFKPLSTRKVSSSKNAAEEDEPTNIICGIENMFAGIHEDQSDTR